MKKYYVIGGTIISVSMLVKIINYVDKIKKKKNKIEFKEKLLIILKIILPSIKTKEFGILSLHTLVLITKTILTIYISKLDGKIVKSIVGMKKKNLYY